MKKLFIITLCLIQIVLQAQPSPDDIAHRKYWYYRTRMINDFIKIGKQQGDCIVFAERNNFKTK